MSLPFENADTSFEGARYDVEDSWAVAQETGGSTVRIAVAL